MIRRHHFKNLLRGPAVKAAEKWRSSTTMRGYFWAGVIGLALASTGFGVLTWPLMAHFIKLAGWGGDPKNGLQNLAKAREMQESLGAKRSLDTPDSPPASCAFA